MGSSNVWCFSKAGPSLTNFVSSIIKDGPAYYIFSNRTVNFFPETHWILDHFDFTQDWILIELFCVQSFKGVTPRGRHTRPICN